MAHFLKSLRSNGTEAFDGPRDKERNRDFFEERELRSSRGDDPLRERKRERENSRKDECGI